jgi:hypothetical protein
MSRRFADRINDYRPLRYPMNKIKYHLPLFSMIMLLFCFHLQANETRGPRLVIPESIYDAKEVQEGTQVDHSFRFKNEGDALLEIKRVNPG